MKYHMMIAWFRLELHYYPSNLVWTLQQIIHEWKSMACQKIIIAPPQIKSWNRNLNPSECYTSIRLVRMNNWKMNHTPFGRQYPNLTYLYKKNKVKKKFFLCRYWVYRKGRNSIHYIDFAINSTDTILLTIISLLTCIILYYINFAYYTISRCLWTEIPNIT